MAATPMDFYKVLGVDPTAAAEDITKAYKELAKKYHPDKNKDKDTTKQFQCIGEAYATLNDKEKKAAYDLTQRKPGPFDYAESIRNLYKNGPPHYQPSMTVPETTAKIPRASTSSRIPPVNINIQGTFPTFQPSVPPTSNRTFSPAAYAQAPPFRMPSFNFSPTQPVGYMAPHLGIPGGTGPCFQFPRRRHRFVATTSGVLNQSPVMLDPRMQNPYNSYQPGPSSAPLSEKNDKNSF